MTAPETNTTPPQAAPPVGPPPVPPRAPRTPSRQTRRHQPQGPIVEFLASINAPSASVRHTITGAHATLALGGLEHMAAVPWGYPAVLGGVLAVGGAAWANSKSAEGGFGAAVGAAVGGWLVWSAETSPWSISNLAALAVAAVGAGFWYRKLRRNFAVKEQFERQMAAAAMAAAGTKKARDGWQEILDKAGCKGVVVEKTTPLDTGAEGVRIEGALNDANYDFRTLAGALGAIEMTADRLTKYDIPPGSVAVYPTKKASQFIMTIPTASLLEGIIWHPIEHGPRSVEDPIEFATAADGRRVSVLHRDTAHGLFSGATDFGKSNALNVLLWEWTRSVDAEVFLIAGPTKAARTIKPLLAPWLRGEVERPPVQRIAPTWRTAMETLWDIKAGIRKRSKGKGLDDVSDKWEVTPEAPRIIIPIEEAGELLNNDKDRWKAPDGSKWTFGDLLVDVITRARSEGMNVILLTQGSTMDLLGERGTSLKKQIVFRVAFHATMTSETNGVLASDTGRVDLANLGKGEVYTETSPTDTRPTRALVDFMGGGSGEEDLRVRIGREHHQYSHEIDEFTASAMPFYADRWTNPDVQSFLDELMGRESHVATDQTEGSSTVPDVEDLADLDDVETVPDEFTAEARQRLDRYRADIEKMEGGQSTANAAEEIEALNAAFNMSPRSVGDLDSNTLKMLGVFKSTTEGVLSAAELRARVAEQLSVPDNEDTDRDINAAIRDITGLADDDALKKAGVKGRPYLEGKKTTAWYTDKIREAIRSLGG